MAGLESFNMANQRHRPSRSVSENPPQLETNLSDTEIMRQQQREKLMELSRNRGKFEIEL